MTTSKQYTNKAFREGCLKNAIKQALRGLKAHQDKVQAKTQSDKDHYHKQVKEAFKEAQLFSIYATLSDAEMKVLRVVNPDLSFCDGGSLPAREEGYYDTSVSKLIVAERLLPSYSDHKALVAKICAEHKIPKGLFSAKKDPHKTVFAAIHLTDKLNVFQVSRVMQIQDHRGMTQAGYVGRWCQRRPHAFDVVDLTHQNYEVKPKQDHELIKLIKDFAKKVNVTSKLVNPIVATPVVSNDKPQTK